MIAVAEPEQAIVKDPYHFGRSVLAHRRCRGQKQLHDAILSKRRVHCRSGNAYGKTREIAATIVEWLIEKPRRRAICTGPTYDAVYLGLWQEIRLAYAAMVASLGTEVGSMGMEGWKLGDGWDANILSVDNISAAQGMRGVETLIAVDEAQGVDDQDLIDALDSLMSSPGSRMVQSGNPLFPGGRYYEDHLKSDWHCIQLDCLDHPNVVTGREIFPGAITRLAVEEKRTRWGEKDPRWISRVRGNFPGDSAKTVMTRTMIQHGKTPTAKDGRHIGLDAAGDGDDLNVASLVVDRVKVDEREWTGVDTMGTVGKSIQLMREWNVTPENFHLDASGLGAGIRDRLREQGYNVDGVVFGDGPKNDWAGVTQGERFLNRRVELHYIARQLFMDGELAIDPKFDSTIRDLTAVQAIQPLSDGKSRLEEKKAVIKRIGHSPDHGDSFLIALSRTGSMQWVITG